MRVKTLVVAILLLTTLPVLAQAVIGPFPVFPKPSFTVHAMVQMGWFEGTQVWFGCTATNNLKFINTVPFGDFAVLTPKLSSALVPKLLGGLIAAQPVYVVTNLQNPPVFSTVPARPLYSALWQVFTVTWLPGVAPRPICSALPASPSNPTGLPGPAEAVIVATDVVLDCPILAVGPLTSPFSTSGPNYIIPQATAVDPLRKEIAIPEWATYCTDSITKRCFLADAAITDVGDPALASVLKANFAPGLLNMPDSDTSDFFVMRGPKPIAQLPVVSDCVMFTGMRRANTDLDYSPVMRYVILERKLPVFVTVCSIDTLRLFILNGCLTVLSDTQRINAAVFPD